MATFNESGPIRFFNNFGSTLKVERTGSGIVAFLPFQDLIVQKSSPDTFFIKSGSFLGYFRYPDVSQPVTSSIDVLLQLLFAWAQEAASDAATSGAGVELLSIETMYDVDSYEISEAAVGGASSQLVAGESVTMSLPGSAAATIVRQSRSYLPATLGTGTRAFVSGVLSSSPTLPYLVTRIGVFDDGAAVTYPGSAPAGNGVFFQWDPAVGDIVLVYRSSMSGAQVDTVVPRADWNLDMLDGTGATPVALTVGGLFTFVIDWNTDDTTFARAGIYTDGHVTFCHKFTTFMPGLLPFTSRALPIRWEAASTDPAAENAGVAMLQGGARVVALATATTPVAHHARTCMFYTTVPKRLTVADATVPILSLRLSASANRARLLPKRITLMNLASAGVGRWDLIINCAVLTAPAFGPAASPAAYALVSTAETAASGGSIVASGYFYDMAPVDVALDIPKLLAAIDGTPDVLTLLVTNMQSSINVVAGIEWVEDN